MANTGKTGTKRLTGVGAFLVTGALLLAACGDDPTPTPITAATATLAGSSATSTIMVDVTAEPTTGTDTPFETPIPSDTAIPGVPETATPEAMIEGTATPGTAETPGAVIEGDTIRVVMNAQNGSNQSGTATITDLKVGAVNVVLDITGPGSTEPQPAHIHRGTCADLDPNPAFPLSNAVDGKSVTEISVNFKGFASTKYAINVHKSAAEANVYVSCGDITVGPNQ